MARSRWLLVAAFLAPFAAAPAVLARAADGELCAAAVRAAERASSLPSGLIGAVSFAESGRRDPERRRAIAWPWTVNNAGDGRYFATKGEAIAHVEALRAQGKRNIDVGCMQINLMHHPDAFASLEEAFDPAANVAYGARFLEQLQRETGSWTRAVERYHTADVARGQAYRSRVLDCWQDTRFAEAAGAPARRRVPAVMPGRGQLASLTGRGFLSLTRNPVDVAVLRPPERGRRTVGLVRTDGRITGSLLRLGPRRRALGSKAPARAGPAAEEGLRRLDALRRAG